MSIGSPCHEELKLRPLRRDDAVLDAIILPYAVATLGSWLFIRERGRADSPDTEHSASFQHK